jgi:hypothetical protein
LVFGRSPGHADSCFGLSSGIVDMLHPLFRASERIFTNATRHTKRRRRQLAIQFYVAAGGERSADWGGGVAGSTCGHFGHYPQITQIFADYLRSGRNSPVMSKGAGGKSQRPHEDAGDG